ncbi:hypothetical protein AB1K32_14965 [Metabacillus dongyingensis]|uniref:hypothetical protein n=1 Tax=Metabacillus dongyingensis TaxID=2874282 RepID=UPI003B8B9D6B
MVTAFGAGFGEEEMANSGASVFWLSALSIFLGFTSWKWKKISGAGLIIISLVGLFMNGLFFILAFIFLLIAGILAFRIKPKHKPEIAA